jgi:uncharacterized protein (TIGR02466 family)
MSQLAKIELWFPVSIYTVDNLLDHTENQNLKEYCLTLQNKVPNGGDDWYGGTYNTHGTLDLTRDLKFKPLLNIIDMHVHEYSKAHNSTAQYKIRGSWLNIAEKNQFQEFHTHNDSIISAVYYISAPQGSGSIVFEDPKEPDMYPLKNIKPKNNLSFTRIKYEAVEGKLLIFRSYLRHMVEAGSNEDPRISVAINYN